MKNLEPCLTCSCLQAHEQVSDEGAHQICNPTIYKKKKKIYNLQIYNQTSYSWDICSKNVFCIFEQE